MRRKLFTLSMLATGVWVVVGVRGTGCGCGAAARIASD